MDDSETEREEQSIAAPAPSKKKCLFDDSIVGKVGALYTCGLSANLTLSPPELITKTCTDTNFWICPQKSMV